MTKYLSKKWHNAEELATFHDNIGIVMFKNLHSTNLLTEILSKKIGIVLWNLPRSMTVLGQFFKTLTIKGTCRHDMSTKIGIPCHVA